MTAATSTVPARFDRRLFAPMTLGSILNPINSSIITIALVPIGRDLGEPTDHSADCGPPLEPPSHRPRSQPPKGSP